MPCRTSHLVFSGSFCDAGVKNVATASSIDTVSFSEVPYNEVRLIYLLVVVDRTFLLRGGGDTRPGSERVFLFIRSGLSCEEARLDPSKFREPVCRWVLGDSKPLRIYIVA